MFRALFVGVLLAVPVAAQAASPVEICQTTWTDPARANRPIPLTIRIPAGTGRVPLVLFSHGLGGNRDSGADWTAAWAAAGIAVISLQHPGSDRAVLFDGGLAAAASFAQFEARIGDVKFVLDTVPRRQAEGACDLRRIDMHHIGMAGHSFGAITTQAIAGQHFPIAALNRFADSRITAAIAFSPSPAAFDDDKDAFGAIRMPFLSVTGTADVAPRRAGVSAADRQRPYRAMPAGGKYLLVLDGANHLQFNGQDGLRPDMTPDPHTRAVTIAATTAFWRMTLLGDKDAAAWLGSPEGLTAMLSGRDSFAAK